MLLPHHQRIVNKISQAPISSVVAAVIIFSIFIRVGIYYLYPPYESLVTDARWYFTIAQNLAYDAGFRYSVEPTAYRPPGTSFILSLFFRLAGATPATSAAVFCAFFLLLLQQMYQLAYTLFDRQSAKLTLIVLALWPEWWFFSIIPMSDLLFTVLFITLLNQLLRINPEKAWQFALLGILLALTIATRVIGMVAIPLIIWYCYQHFNRRIAIRNSVITVLVAAVILTPWVYRNHQLFGAPGIANNGGLNLHIGHNRYATGAYMRLPIPRELKDENEFVIDTWHRQQAIQYIKSDPLSVLANTPKKLSYAFIYHVNAVQNYFQGVSKNRRHHRYFWMAACQAVYFLFIAALVLLWTRTRAKLKGVARVFVYGYTLITALIVITFFGSSRFIMPILPLWMALFSYWALEELRKRTAQAH